jgi:ribosome-associated protein
MKDRDIEVDASKTSAAHEKARALALICAKAADDKKASDIIILDIAPLSSFSDFFVICSAPSERQVHAIVKSVQDAARDEGFRAASVEGLESASWVLIDFGDMIFHCFTDAAREYYDLEGFWIDAEKSAYP